MQAFDNRQADGPNRFSFLAIFQAKAAAFDVDFAPPELGEFAATTAGERQQSDNLRGYLMLPIDLRFAKFGTDQAILGFRQSAIADIVFWLADAERGIGFDDASLDSIGQYSSQQANSSGGSTGAASHNRLTSQFRCLDVDRCLAGHDVFHRLVDVRLVQILDPPRSEQRHNMAVDTTSVGVDSRLFLRSPAFAEDQAGIEVGQIQGAKFFDRNRLPVDLPLFLRIFALSHAAQLNARFPARHFGGPDAVHTDR